MTLDLTSILLLADEAQSSFLTEDEARDRAFRLAQAVKDLAEKLRLETKTRNTFAAGLVKAGQDILELEQQLAEANKRIEELEGVLEQARRMLETDQRASAFRLLGVKAII